CLDMRRALVVALVVGVVAGGCGSTSPTERAARERAAAVRDAARQAGLDPAVQRFFAIAAGATGHQFRVSYAVGSDTGATATLFQRPPRKRVDLATDPNGASVVRSVIVDTTGAYSCAKTADAWKCSRTATPNTGISLIDAASLQNTLEALGKARHDYRF